MVLVSRHLTGLFAACLVAGGLFLWTAPEARADACDDLAKQLKTQIDGLTIGATRINQIELNHPAVKRATLGCSSRNTMNEIFATTESRKPSTAFYNFVATAAAFVFTIPKSDAMNGTTRCVRRIGFLRGYSIVTRYRRLDIRCSGGKAGTTVSILRERDS